MVRTQVYLTKRERDEVAALAAATGKKQSEVIREAIDAWLEQSGGARLNAALDVAAGLWKDREDLPDFRAMREEWTRR